MLKRELTIGEFIDSFQERVKSKRAKEEIIYLVLLEQ